MAANDYHFVTTWRIGATPEEISAVLGDAAALGRWWPSVYLRVSVLEDGDDRGIGKVVDLRLELARRHAAGYPTVLAALPPPPRPTFPHNVWPGMRSDRPS